MGGRGKMTENSEIFNENLMARFEQALSLHQEGKYEDAVLGYQKILEENREHRPSLLNLGVIYYVKSSYDQALDNFQKALDLDSTDVEALYNMGKTLQARKEFSRSLEFLKKAHEGNPEDTQTLKGLAMGYFELGCYEEAQTVLAEYLEQNPDDLESLMCFSESQIHLGRFDIASFGLKRVIDLSASEERAYELLADCYYHQGRTEKSIETLERLLRFKKDDPGIYRKLAMYFGQTKNFGQARKCYRNAYSMESHHLSKDHSSTREAADIDRITFQNSILSITEKYSSKNDWKGALSEFSRLSKHYPDSAILLQEIAYIYQITDQFKRAASYYEKILILEPSHLEALLQLMRIAIELRDFQTGVRWADKALAAWSDILEVYELAGLFYASFDEFEKGLEYFTHCKQSGMDTCGVMLGSSQCQMGLNNHAEALNILTAAVKIFPSNVDLVLNLAKCHLKLNQVREAVSLMRKARKSFTGNFQVLSMSTEVAIASGNLKKAGEFWEAMATLVPHDKEDFEPFIKALVYVQEPDMALKYLKSHTRFKLKNFETLYLEALIYTVLRDKVRFNIHWQEIWYDSSEEMCSRVQEVKSLLNKESVQFMVHMQQTVHGLFVRKPDILQQFEEFFRVLVRPTTLEVVK
jgi:tetratricopeptide (TPR) repeat protein